MDLARELVASNPENHQVIWAGEQKSGRGRRARHWSSPPGNLYMTVALNLHGPAAKAAELSFVAGLAMRAGLADLIGSGGLDVKLKWPNDLLLNDAKVAGFLLETAGVESNWMLIGSGVNLRHYPEDTPYPATSLTVQGVEIAIASLAARYLHHLDAGFHQWQKSGFAPVRENWKVHAAGLGGPVTARLATETLTGTFCDLDPEGALILRQENGEESHILAGDVFFGMQRPADYGS